MASVSCVILENFHLKVVRHVQNVRKDNILALVTLFVQHVQLERTLILWPLHPVSLVLMDLRRYKEVHYVLCVPRDSTVVQRTLLLSAV